MKVSFGRIIPINSISAPDYYSKKKRVDNSTYNVAKVLNSEKTSAYSKSEAANIRNFFQAILGDYNGKDGIIMKRTQRGDDVLISGKDAQQIKEIEKGKNKSSEKSQAKIEELIYAKLENGNGKKKDSVIILGSSTLSRNDLTFAQIAGESQIKTKLDQFGYMNVQHYYTAELDGFIRKDIEPTDKETCENQCANVIAEYQELKL